MIADEIEATVKAIPHPVDTVSNSEYSDQVHAYDDAKKKALTEFRDRLAAEYASDLPERVQAKIWAKSWNVAGRSYVDVEIAYIDNTDFAKFARYTK